MTNTHIDTLTLNDFVPAAYDELVKAASSRLWHERRTGFDDPCELVHEAFIRLKASGCECFSSQAYAFGAFHRVMTRCLIDDGRAASCQKRGGGMERVWLQDGTVLVDPPDLIEALTLSNAVAFTSRSGQVVLLTLIEGHTAREVAELLDVSPATVRSDLAQARKRIKAELGLSGPNGSPGKRAKPASAGRYVTVVPALAAEPTEALADCA